MTDKTADFTQGSILKKLVAFMLPVLGALILQAAYGALTFWSLEDLVLPPGFLLFLPEARF